MECACYFGKTMFELFDPDADVRIEMGTSLPHWYQPGVSYFVTFRTEDSMPVEVSRRWHAQRADWLHRHGISMGNRNWRDQLDRLDVALRRDFHDTFSRQYMEALDKGLGACVLRRPELSKIVADALLHFDGDRYHMGDFVVMPNHWFITPLADLIHQPRKAVGFLNLSQTGAVKNIRTRLLPAHVLL